MNRVDRPSRKFDSNVISLVIGDWLLDITEGIHSNVKTQIKMICSKKNTQVLALAKCIESVCLNVVMVRGIFVKPSEDNSV